MVRSGYPFRDPNRRSDDSLGNRRDDMVGNRRDDAPGNRRDDAAANRRDRDRDQRPERRPRAESGPPAGLGGLTGDIEELLRLLAGSDITELQVERGDLKVTIRRGGGPAPAHAHPPGASASPPLQLGGLHLAPETLAAGDVRGGAPVPPPAGRPPPTLPPTPGHPATPVLTEREHLLTAPMVGTFYAAPSPKDPPFVNEGDLIEAGQTIGIIEAMKIMNEIEAEVTGHVRRILVRDAQGVEFGQPLMVIEEV
jgi:acetyl-CoA carboxylase biotin carboxyl carrier protein